MSTLTVEFTGITEDVIQALIKGGYVKTKAEALRYALVHLGEELGLVKHKPTKAEMERHKEAARRGLEILHKGFDMGKILYKHRSELYDR